MITEKLIEAGLVSKTKKKFGTKQFDTYKFLKSWLGSTDSDIEAAPGLIYSGKLLLKGRHNLNSVYTKPIAIFRKGRLIILNKLLTIAKKAYTTNNLNELKQELNKQNLTFISHKLSKLVNFNSFKETLLKRYITVNNVKKNNFNEVIDWQLKLESCDIVLFQIEEYKKINNKNKLVIKKLLVYVNG